MLSTTAQQLLRNSLWPSAASSSVWVALVRAGDALQPSALPSPPCDSSTNASQCIQVRTATKKAGGSARQNPDTKSRNLGVKLLHNEVIFPGQIVVRQRGTKYHPGYNVGLGKDHTIYATSVGRVRFSKETVQYMGGRTKDRTVVSVVPLNGDWSPAYKELEVAAIERRATIKRKLLKAHAHEAALFFPLPSTPPPLHIPLPPPLPRTPRTAHQTQTAPSHPSPSKGGSKQSKQQEQQQQQQ